MIDFEISAQSGTEVIYVNAMHVRTVRQAPKGGTAVETILGMSDGSEIWVRGRAGMIASALEADMAKIPPGTP